MPEKPKVLKAGDPCPIDGGKFIEVPNADEKDGTELYRCASCGYYTRFPVKAK